jgi:uncharacterized protein (DUF362 family)
MCLDLNRCLYYSDAKQLCLEAEAPVRRVFTVLDGIVAGEGDGPLAPSDVPLGAVIASCDPVAADLVAIRLMGFDETRVPKVAEAMRDPGPRITGVRSAADVRVLRVSRDGRAVESVTLDDLEASRVFAPHPGWRGKLERGAA